VLTQKIGQQGAPNPQAAASPVASPSP